MARPSFLWQNAIGLFADSLKFNTSTAVRHGLVNERLETGIKFYIPNDYGAYRLVQNSIHWGLFYNNDRDPYRQYTANNVSQLAMLLGLDCNCCANLEEDGMDTVLNESDYDESEASAEAEDNTQDDDDDDEGLRVDYLRQPPWVLVKAGGVAFPRSVDVMRIVGVSVQDMTCPDDRFVSASVRAPYYEDTSISRRRMPDFVKPWFENMRFGDRPVRSHNFRWSRAHNFKWSRFDQHVIRQREIGHFFRKDNALLKWSSEWSGDEWSGLEASWGGGELEWSGGTA